MIAKPGGSCWKKKSPFKQFGTLQIPETIASPKNCCSEAWVSGIRILVGSPTVSFWGVDQFVWLQLRTHPKKTATWLDRNKQTNIHDSSRRCISYETTTGELVHGFTCRKYRRVYLSRFVYPNLARLKAAHDHWSINGKHGSSYGAIDGSSLDGEFLIDRLCSAFPSEWNILHIYIYTA